MLLLCCVVMRSCPGLKLTLSHCPQPESQSSLALLQPSPTLLQLLLLNHHRIRPSPRPLCRNLHWFCQSANDWAHTQRDIHAETICDSHRHRKSAPHSSQPYSTELLAMMLLGYDQTDSHHHTNKFTPWDLLHRHRSFFLGTTS